MVTMKNLTIEALSPQNAQLFITYLKVMDFHHAPDWAGCFCQYYHQDCTDAEWQRRSADANENDTLQAIQNKTMKGFLAFYGDKVVGWVNANHVEAYLKLIPLLSPYCHSPRTGCIVCFVIHPDYRHQGIASQLLGYAIASFKQEGYTTVLGFPSENQVAPEKAYRGFIKMYRDLGFELLKNHQGSSIMRKEL